MVPPGMANAIPPALAAAVSQPRLPPPIAAEVETNPNTTLASQSIEPPFGECCLLHFVLETNIIFARSSRFYHCG